MYLYNSSVRKSAWLSDACPIWRKYMKNYVEICDHNSWLGETGDMIKALD